VFHFRSFFLAMSTSSESMLEHIANYLKFNPAPNPSGLCSIRATTMTATLPVNSVCSQTTTRCFSSLPAWHRTRNLASQSSPRQGESSSVGIDLQLTVVLLSWNKKRWGGSGEGVGGGKGGGDGKDRGEGSGEGEGGGGRGGGGSGCGGRGEMDYIPG
jgi:hypothetical protein